MRSRLRTLLLLVATLALGACANQEKAELSLLLNTATRHPEFVQAVTRQDVAKVLAGMDLNAQQAAALKTWADTDGAAIRGEIEAKAAELDALAPQIETAADSLILEKATTEARQEELLDAGLGENRPTTDETTPVQIGELVYPHLDTLRPAVAALSDRQQLVAIGSWGQLVTSVSNYVTLSKADVAAMGDEATGDVVAALLEVRGFTDIPDDDLLTELRGIAMRLPTGRQAPGEVESLVSGLLEQVPANDPEQQVHEATGALGTLLVLEPASELLALVN